MRKLKKLPQLETDQQAVDEVATIDLSKYDLSGFKPVQFELQKKDARLELRLPEDQLAALKALAKKQGIPHTRLARHLIEQGMQALRA